jgi:hypothetical protein
MIWFYVFWTMFNFAILVKWIARDVYSTHWEPVPLVDAWVLLTGMICGLVVHFIYWA